MPQEEVAVEAVESPVEGQSDLSGESLSTEIGSGDVADEVIAESTLSQVVDESTAAEMEKLAEDVEAAVEEGASPEEVQKLIEVFKIKVNGQDKEVTLDWNDKDAIIKQLQMAAAGSDAMQKSAELEKTYASELQRMKSDPWEVLEELGIDPLELAEARIEQEIQQMQKSPEQIAQEKANSELEALREKIKKQEETQQAKEYEVLQKQAEADLDSEITEAISATSDLPKTPYIMKRVADAMIWAMDQGYADVKPADVISTVEKEFNSELQQLLDEMPDKVLEKYLGNKTIDRLRKKRLDKMPKSPSNLRETGKMPVENKEEKRQSMRDFLKNGIK